MKIGDEVYIHGFVDEIRKDTVIIRNKGGYFGTDAEEVTPTVERKKGKWIDGQCSECGCDIPAYIIDWKWQKDMDAKFCPMCGARMERGEANESSNTESSR